MFYRCPFYFLGQYLCFWQLFLRLCSFPTFYMSSIVRETELIKCSVRSPSHPQNFRANEDIRAASCSDLAAGQPGAGAGSAASIVARVGRWGEFQNLYFSFKKMMISSVCPESNIQSKINIIRTFFKNRKMTKYISQIFILARPIIIDGFRRVTAHTVNYEERI